MLYRSLLQPLLFRLPAETVHDAAKRTLSLAVSSEIARRMVSNHFKRSPFGALDRFGLSFDNPVGLAAGFDKDGTAAPALAALGFGFIEVGTVTNLPQPGNPLPRLFRLPKDCALINRQGFNNHGAARLAARLAARRPNCVLGVNIGKSRVVPVEEAIPDYLASFEQVHRVADYIAVNVSSPNTPRLRELQRADRLAELLNALEQRNHELSRASNRAALPLLVKIAPDVSQSDLEMIVGVSQAASVSGIIATNTTTSRDGLRTPPHVVAACGEGGLSGKPLCARSTAVIATLHRLTRGGLTIIGVGGIFNAEDAWEKISAGASLVQLYTGLVYEGIGIARNINDGLERIFQQQGLRSFDEAVGCRAVELAAE